MNDADSRRLLGAFIRAHRERLPPPGGGRRRTPGWRREELAEACGISVTWITWLEQGREVSPSSATLERLARALRLSPAERMSLFDLAGRHDPEAAAVPLSVLPPEVLGLPQLVTVPAYLLDHGWSARAWNAAAADLFRGWLDGGTERNLLRYVFLSETAPGLVVDWEERAGRLAAEFRADFSRRPRDPRLRSLVAELQTQSPLFARVWQEQQVLPREGGERAFQHPLVGVRRYRQTTLIPASHPECKLVCLTPMADGA